MGSEPRYLTTGKPRGQRAALITSVAATVASVILAVLPSLFGPATYDPTLAVLTATLIALVWYTFFTYQAAARLEPSFVSIRLDRDGLEVEPRVENPTRRSLNARIWMRIWAAGIEQPQSPFYSGADRLFLPPEGKFKGCVQARPYFAFQQNEAGENIPTVTEIRVMLRVKWSDDSGESGDTGPRYYRIVGSTLPVESVVGREEIARHFPQGAGDISEPE